MPLDLDHRQIQIRARQERLAELTPASNRRVRRRRTASTVPCPEPSGHGPGFAARGLGRVRSAFADLGSILVAGGSPADGQFPIAARSRGSR